MSGILRHTHALFWLVSGEEVLTDEALIAIGESQEVGTLLVSPITAWELRRNPEEPHRGPPAFGGRPARPMVSRRGQRDSARVVPIHQRISFEAASVVTHTGHKDPGDCFLIATARLRKVPIVTRDAIIRTIAQNDPDYLQVVVR